MSNRSQSESHHGAISGPTGAGQHVVDETFQSLLFLLMSVIIFCFVFVFFVLTSEAVKSQCLSEMSTYLKHQIDLRFYLTIRPHKEMGVCFLLF